MKCDDFTVPTTSVRFHRLKMLMCTNFNSLPCRSRPEIDATACTLYNFPRGYDPAGQALTTATDFSGVQDLPEIRCTSPAGADAQRDVNIYWHGIPVTLTAWWHYMAPTVSTVVPSAGGFAGGATITVLGSNFGPQESWTTTSAGGLVRAAGVKAIVEIVGKSAVACRSTQWVSDGQLVCVLPPLPSQKQAVNIEAHKVSVQVTPNTTLPIFGFLLAVIQLSQNMFVGSITLFIFHSRYNHW